ncbi:MAG: metallophosphoesterase family protein [Clostridia bacterium]|nr:metallophosphoesterase family protein [Clostridia bacterium]
MKNIKRLLCLVMCVCIAATCTVSFASAQEANGTTPFRLSVTVNGDTATDRGFCWYTAAQADTKIEFEGLAADAYTVEDVTCEEWDGNWMHKLVVTGLTKGTTYRYRVGDGTTWSEWGTFTTDDGDNKVSFINIADVQASNLENFQKGAATLAAAFTKLPTPDFVSNCGDFTDDSTNEEWNWYDEAFGAMNRTFTIVPVAGNHDGLGVEYWFNNMFALDTTESVQVKDGVNYSFDFGNAHFAVLNTNDVLSISTAQLEWLKNDLNSTDKDWKIVFMHKAPYSLGKDAKWPDALYLQECLPPIMAECNVDMVFYGHDHQYLRTKPLTNNQLDPNGTTWVLSGTAGAKRYEIRKFLAGHYMKTEFIDTLVIQKDGYGNFWANGNWDSTSEGNIGGCFETVEIDGTELWLTTYILNDKTGEINKVDEVSFNKKAGENKATFKGDNTTSETDYILSLVPSFLGLAKYAITKWLPEFFKMLPALLESVIVEDTF